MLYRKLLISINKLEIECVCNCIKETKIQNFNKHAFHPRLTYNIKTIPFFKDFFTRYHVLKKPVLTVIFTFLKFRKKSIRQWYYLNEFIL